MLTDEQIQDLLDSNDEYNRMYFSYCIGEDDPTLEEFFELELMLELDEKVLALMIEEDMLYYDAESAIDNKSWRVLEDDEATKLAEQFAQSRLDDELYDLPEHLHYYFNSEEYIKDYANDRGSLLAYYDGEEREQTINETTYYLYKC